MKNLTLAFLLAFVGINAAQNCGPTVTWSEADYQNVPASLNDPAGTPLGFRRGLTIPNPELMLNPPCVQFTVQASIQYIEVAAEPVGFSSSRMCVTIYGTNAQSQPACSEGLAYYCGNVVGTSNSGTALFNCDGESCDLSDIEIYYRVVISESLDVDLENWCQNNRTMDFPSSLLAFVPPTNDVTPPEINTDDGAMATHPLSFITLLSFLLAIAYLRHYLNL